MSWSPDLHIGELRPWPEFVQVVRGKTEETRRYVPERTCRIVEDERGPDYHCTACGGMLNDEFWYVVESCGCSRCPHCGARIEEG